MCSILIVNSGIIGSLFLMDIELTLRIFSRRGNYMGDISEIVFLSWSRPRFHWYYRCLPFNLFDILERNSQLVDLDLDSVKSQPRSEQSVHGTCLPLLAKVVVRGPQGFCTTMIESLKILPRTCTSVIYTNCNEDFALWWSLTSNLANMSGHSSR